jgi:ABC-type glutathione transport system ATPase component
MSREPLLNVKDLAVRFPIREGLVRERTVAEVRAVDGVSFEVAKGEILGLVGESGCGKSTVARAITRVVKPSAGTIDFDGQNLATAEGRELHELRRRVQMIFQDPYASLNPRMTVGAILREPAEIYKVGTNAERSDRVTELLELVGLDPRFAERYPHEFSGGQRQRIGIARALYNDPDVLVLDEATSSLDTETDFGVMQAVKALQRNKTVIIVAHRLSTVEYCDRLYRLDAGRIVDEGTFDEVMNRSQS